MNEYLINFITSEFKKSEICNRILRSLPDWFGIESAIVDYTNDVKTMLMWTVEKNNEIIGFISIKKHFSESAEIHVMGIKKEFHGQRYGKELIKTAESYLAAEGIKYLTVKTLSESRPDSFYDKTRTFYLKNNFLPVEEFKTLWGEHNPCLLMIKSISLLSCDHKLNDLKIKLDVPKYEFDENLQEKPISLNDYEEFIKNTLEQIKLTNDHYSLFINSFL